MHAFVFALASVLSGGVVDPGIVQEAYVYELNLDGKTTCPSALTKDGQPCAALGRRFELLRGQRDRALSLVNGQEKAPAKSCDRAPTHAFVFKTTKGYKAVEANFVCHQLGGKALSPDAERDLVSFVRSFGLVYGL